MRPYLVMGTLAALCLAFAPLPLQRAKKPAAPSARVMALMEGYRTEVPPAEGLGEQNGLTVKELEPYLMSHLAGVARRMGVRTRAECATLMPYLKDRDLKLRFIAMQAIDGATKAYPSGTSAGWFLDTGSEGHRKMVARFAELIDKLGP